MVIWKEIFREAKEYTCTYRSRRGRRLGGVLHHVSFDQNSRDFNIPIAVVVSIIVVIVQVEKTHKAGLQPLNEFGKHFARLIVGCFYGRRLETPIFCEVKVRVAYREKFGEFVVKRTEKRKTGANLFREFYDASVT